MNWTLLTTLLAIFIVSVKLADSQTTSPKRNCNSVKYLSTKTQCKNCRLNIRTPCPSSYTKTSRGIGRRGCRYRRRGRPTRGCYHTCIQSIKIEECCQGFWGPDCQSCPKGRRGHVCSDRGICSDKKSGNGTCACRGRVTGSACESCSARNQYGPSCEQNCSCVNGVCDAGVERLGTCLCHSGFGGALCDIALAGCAQMHCHANSRCLNDSGSLVCLCLPGYEGNGTDCQPINPCQDTGSNLCHRNADCIHSGPAKYDCKCQTGYSGDGRWCGPIDPCQTGNGGCPPNTTMCQYTGPGNSTCTCKPGYANMTNAGCSLVDICNTTINTTCDSMANCTTVDVDGIIQVKCRCPAVYLTQGLRCYGDIFKEILDKNASGIFANRLNKAISMFSSTYFDNIFYSKAYHTLVVPLDSAFGSELGQPNSSAMWNATARAHIVQGTIDVDFSSQSAKTMYPLLGWRTSIKALKPTNANSDSDSEEDDGTFALINFANSYTTGKFVVSAQLASNGAFYISNRLLEPPNNFPIKNYDAASMSVLETLQAIPSTSSFQKWWQDSYATRFWFLNNVDRYTIFVPSNDAINLLDSDAEKALSNPKNRNKLDILLRHHISLSLISAATLAESSQLQMTSETVQVNVSLSSGQINIGNNFSKILLSEIPVDGGKGFFYLIDKLLVPDFIQPLVKNFCQRIQETSRQGPCQHCQTSNPTCPEGSVFAKRQLCARNVETIGSNSPSLGQRLGCRAVCKVNVTSSICCSGYFGTNCGSCPGPVGSPCNGNGNCDDGLNGLGLCSCRQGVEGDDCSVCSNPNSYGPQCSLNCTCKRGVCDNRISSRGICVPGSCNESWAGENCDRPVSKCGAQVLNCHQNAICQEVQGVESCVCDPGYTGDGANCVEFNPCVDADDRGGCDENAVCLYGGWGNVSCACKINFIGNGKTCEAINPCKHSWICHQNAKCIFTGPGSFGCQCKPGYRGSGDLCTEINNCLLNNGGCHMRANCRKTGPGTNDCKCQDGFSGDGHQCVGTLMLEIAEHPQLSIINHWIENMPKVRQLFQSIRNDHLTAFLPRNQAWNDMSPSDYQFWVNDEHLPSILSYHITPMEIPSYQLNTKKSLETLLPHCSILVTNLTSGITEKELGSNTTQDYLLPTLGSVHAKIVDADLRVFNGLTNIIDTVLLPPRDTVGTYPTLAQAAANATGTDLAVFSAFFDALNSSGIIDDIENSNTSYTIFAIDNDLFNPNLLPKDPKKVLQYHVVPGKMIRTKDVENGQHEPTMSGPGYLISLTRSHGQVLVNRQQITRRDVRTRRGIVQGIVGDSLKPVKSRCDVTNRMLYVTRCVPCIPMFHKCKEKVGQLHCSIPRPRSSSSSLHPSMWQKPSIPSVMRFCQAVCLGKVERSKCCPGFYGTDCEPCPGGIGNVCYGQGTCMDGINGKGTCNCTNSKFSGIACDECSPGFYGDDCSTSCSCVNGTCNDGRNGDGACACDKGFTGVLCNQRHNPNDACGGRCHTSSRCVDGPLPKCVCARGYSGNGTNCKPVNPCAQSGFDKCHRYASCVYRGPGLYKCTCKRNYKGDGTFCMEINPCTNFNETECDKTNADCHHTGPNQYHCICRKGYEGDGKSCRPENICKKENGGCHRFATCSQTGPGTRKCKCLSNYIGDGVSTCIGSIYQDMRGNSDAAWFFSKEIIRTVLDTAGQLIVFLPNISTVKRAQMQKATPEFFLKHIVGCGSFNSSDIVKHSHFTALDGSVINVTNTSSELFVNGNKLVTGGQIFSNGIVLRINDTIASIPTQTLPGSLHALMTSLNLLKFYQLLSTTGTLNDLSNPVYGDWTLFLPTDDAFNQLSPYKKRQLATEPEVAAEYARYHMISQSYLTPADAVAFQELTTMQGSDLSIGCSPDNIGAMILNNGEAKVLRFISPTLTPLTSPPAFYLIDKVLQPPSVGGRCDVVSNITVFGSCSLCGEYGMGCQTGMTKVGEKPAVCKGLASGGASSFTGCKAVCTTYNVTKKCCDDYYGKDCHRCPGGVDNTCNHHGVCDQGINGTGKCTCDTGFTGYACELCKTGRYGFNCALCKCSVHGTCSEGISGDGTCFCDEGYTGLQCDKKLVHPSNCSSKCVENAVCVEGGQCVCRPGYRGYGTMSCDVPDLCSEKPNGGCSPYARCTQHDNLKVTCTCLPDYKGDGFVCEGVDLCQNNALQRRCHLKARCIYIGPNVTRCSCLPGYKGNGVDRCDPSSGIPRSCAMNNGGCSRQATCVQKTGFVQDVKCVCKKGYVGDGVICNGNLFQVLSEGNYDMGKFFLKLIRRKSYVPQLLSNAENLTLFVPVDSAISFRKLRYRLLKRHMVVGKVYTSAELRKVKAIQVKTKTPLPVQSFPDGSIYINGVKIRTADIIGTNGVIHTMEKVIPNQIRTFQTTTTIASTLSSSAVTQSSANKPSSAVTQANKPPIDGGGLPVKTTTTKPSNVSKATTALPSTKPKAGTKSYSSNNGVKVGVAVAIVFVILIIVIVIYWKKRSSAFVFRPLSDRSRLTSPSQEVFDDAHQGYTMMNPAYDSTGFSENYVDVASEPADSSPFPISSPIEAAEAEEEALIAFNDIGD